MNQDEINKRFDYHAPTDVTKVIHAQWRNHAKWVAEMINALGESRELSLAQTNLEQLSFWVHAHIARNLPVLSLPLTTTNETTN